MIKENKKSSTLPDFAPLTNIKDAKSYSTLSVPYLDLIGSVNGLQRFDCVNYICLGLQFICIYIIKIIFYKHFHSIKG